MKRRTEDPLFHQNLSVSVQRLCTLRRRPPRLPRLPPDPIHPRSPRRRRRRRGQGGRDAEMRPPRRWLFGACLALAVVRDARGRPPARIFVRGVAYDFVPAAGMYKRLATSQAPHAGELPLYVSPDSKERVWEDKSLGIFGGSEDDMPFSALPAYEPLFEEPPEPSAPASVSPLGYDISPMDKESVLAAARRLPEASQAVLLEGTTEQAWAGVTADGVPYADLKGAEDMLFCCAASGLPLFSTRDMYDSGTGWPSFRQPLDDAHLSLRYDPVAGSEEALCAVSRTHLGHKIRERGGVRYCINAAALSCRRMQRATFGLGCFWKPQELFARVRGVIAVSTCYVNGLRDVASYEDLCSGETGAAEAVDVAFDGEVVSYGDLCKLFFAAHDASSFRAQGSANPSDGQYRSLIATRSEEQRRTAAGVLEEVRAGGVDAATVVEPLARLTVAEAAQQHYLRKFRARAGEPLPSAGGAAAAKMSVAELVASGEAFLGWNV